MASKEECKRKEAIHRAGCVEMNMSISNICITDTHITCITHM